MADEAQQEAPKKGKSKLLIMILLLLVIGAGGYIAYDKFFSGKSSGDDSNATEQAEEADPEAEAEDMAPGDTQHVVLPTFLVNLADPLGRRYLKLTIDVEVRSLEAAEQLRANEPKVRDRIILLLSSKTYADLSTYESKIELKEEIVKRLNQILGGSKVNQVYFTEMVIQ